ncbi:hypothetical protein OB920_04920 [Halobacteria archaeon HArc-gm2]|nr:hypothetical protein [Halobacteria archaeon HArc-gm2]
MRWGLLAVLVLAVTAGCGTFTTASESTETVTPVPVTGVPTEEPTPTGIAPGLFGGGVRDVNRLAEAHTNAIEGERYVWHSIRRTDSLPNVSGQEHVVRQNLSVESEQRYQFYTNRRDLAQRGDERLLNDVSEFADGETVYRRFIPFSQQEFTYARQPAEAASVRYESEMAGPVRRYLAVPNATVAEARVDGEPYYRVHSEREMVPGFTRGRNFSATALVSPEGFVRAMNVSYVVDRPDRAVTVEYSFRYERRDDVSVDRPGWVDEQWPQAATESERRLSRPRVDDNGE